MVLFLCRWALASEVLFRAEFTKKEIFVGEQVFCNFALYSKDEVIEVEVAKFPEFRGIWQENIALRQGPVPTVPTVDSRWRKAIIGSYLLIPMLGEIEPVIEPMKIVLRGPLAPMDGDSVVLLSEIGDLKIKALPSLPPGEDAKRFKGAVGQFTVALESNVLTFQKNEPTTLRVSLSGEGNFQEINTLNVDFPSTVEIVSRRSYTEGSGQYLTKTFEITVTIRGEEEVSVSPIEIFYFNPRTKTYEKTASSPIKFTPVTRIKEKEGEAVTLMPVETRWRAYHPLKSNRPFFILQIIFFASFCFFVGSTEVVKWLRRRRQIPAFRMGLKYKIAKRAYREGRVDAFLRMADQLAYDILINRAHLSNVGLTRTEVLQMARSSHLDERVLASARLIFSSFEVRFYSAAKSRPESLEPLVDALQQIFTFRSR